MLNNMLDNHDPLDGGREQRSAITTVVMPIYNEVTQMDFTAPHQVLSMIPDIKIVVASVGGKDVNAQGLCFNNLADLDTIEQCDAIIVPGGLGFVDAMEDARYLAGVRRLSRTAKYTTSVCSGSLLLGAAGLLFGRNAACHWAWSNMLPIFGAKHDSSRVVRDGNIITGGGVTAGMDFALTLVAELRGEDVAQSIQLALEYAPAPPFSAGRPETAPEYIRDTVKNQMEELLGDGRSRVRKFATQMM
jgi:cyclohexyl-isocyanide hydratase